MIITLIIFNVFLILCAWLYCKLTCGICKCSKHLVGKVVIVTGGSTGIGFETAKDLADRGARVILACKSEERGIAARNEIITATGNSDVHYKNIDLSSFSSVRSFAQNVIQTEKSLDILVNNAGKYGSGLERTKDGLLEEMQVNHFSPVLLTILLIPLLKKSAPSRIINVSSEAHNRAKLDIDDLNMVKMAERMKKNIEIYANTKLCNILMTTELSRRLQGTKITCNALHPGIVNSNIFHDYDIPIVKYVLPLIQSFFKSPWEGAQTSIYLAVSPDVEGVSGSYFRDCHIGNISKAARDTSLALKLWKKSEEIIGQKLILNK